MNATKHDRFAVPTPRQARSRKTLEDLVSAAETLLADRPLDAISVEEICHEAGLTTGAFYARFRGKDSLMPLLYARYQDWLAAEGPARFAAVDWNAMSLERACERVGAILVGFFEERTGLLRAATLFARARADAWPPGVPEARRVAVDGIANALRPHLKPGRRDALGFATFAAVAAVREGVLFANAPMAEAGVARARLARDVGRLIRGYLAAAGATESRTGS